MKEIRRDRQGSSGGALVVTASTVQGRERDKVTNCHEEKLSIKTMSVPMANTSWVENESSLSG
jgi:hypothetical protein